MTRYLTLTAAAAAITIGTAGSARAEDPSFGKDLMATIALQGKPCDKLISIKRNGDSDYSVKCKDGNRYHIYVNAKGRVVVDKQ
jgi:hypothetical protein